MHRIAVYPRASVRAPPPSPPSPLFPPSRKTGRPACRWPGLVVTHPHPRPTSLVPVSLSLGLIHHSPLPPVPPLLSRALLFPSTCTYTVDEHQPSSRDSSLSLPLSLRSWFSSCASICTRLYASPTILPFAAFSLASQPLRPFVFLPLRPFACAFMFQFRSSLVSPSYRRKIGISFLARFQARANLRSRSTDAASHPTQIAREERSCFSSAIHDWIACHARNFKKRKSSREERERSRSAKIPDE